MHRFLCKCRLLYSGFQCACGHISERCICTSALARRPKGVWSSAGKIKGILNLYTVETCHHYHAAAACPRRVIPRYVSDSRLDWLENLPGLEANRVIPSLVRNRTLSSHS